MYMVGTREVAVCLSRSAVGSFAAACQCLQATLGLALSAVKGSSHCEDGTTHCLVAAASLVVMFHQDNLLMRWAALCGVYIFIISFL